MEWISAVGVVQAAAIRHLAFEEAKLPLEAEVKKWKELPRSDRLLLYLDSVDQLRIVSKRLAKLFAGEASDEHRRFTEACERKGLPTNAAKPLACSLKGSLQGGELRSEEGVFMLQESKLKMNLGLMAYLLSATKWNLHEVAGIVGRMVFAAAFRRRLLAVLDEFVPGCAVERRSQAICKSGRRAHVLYGFTAVGLHKRSGKSLRKTERHRCFADRGRVVYGCATDEAPRTA